MMSDTVSVRESLEALGITIYKQDYEDEDGYYYSLSMNWRRISIDYHPVERDFEIIDRFYKAYFED